MRGRGHRAHTIEELHAKYAGVLYDLCVRLLGDRSEAEDAVQEVFLNAYRALASFTYGKSHLPWLYRIATNVCFKIMRTRRRKGVALIEDPDRSAAASHHPADTITRDACSSALRTSSTSEDIRFWSATT